MASVETYKDSIVDRYVQDFKKELNIFEKALLLPISNKMKEVLKSNKKINVNSLKDIEELGFWRNVLGIKFGNKQLFDKLVTKVFDFLKEKQEKIIQAETQGRLGELQNLVINGKLDNLADKVEDQKINEDKQELNENDQRNFQGNEISESTGEIEKKTEKETDDEVSKSIDKKGTTEINPVIGGAAAGVASAGLQIGTMKSIEKARGLTGAKEIKNFDVEQTKTLLSNINNKLNEEINCNKNLGKLKSNTYKKTINNFEETIKALDTEGAEAFKDFQKVGNKIPSNLLETLKVDSKILNQISKITDSELSNIIGKDEKLIVKFFDERGIKITEDFAKQLKVAKDVPELKGVVNIFKHSTKLCKIVKGVKGMGVLTFLLAGLDVWCYLETKREAELESKINSLKSEIMKDEATAQLIIGLGSVIVELATIVGICVAGGSVGGPIGTVVGIAVGIVAATLSIGVDTLYFDKKKFYAQNRYNFINQSRTGIKQSIIQLFESDRLDMDEKIKKSIKNDNEMTQDINTVEDAWEALIYQEEIMDCGYYLLEKYYMSGESEKDFLSKLLGDEKVQYKKEKEIMERKINERMNYIKKYLKKGSKGYEKMKQEVGNNKGISFVEQILANSKVYAYLQSDDREPYIENYKSLSVTEYKQAYKDKLSSEYPDEFKQFEALSKSNPLLLWEICYGVELFQNLLIEEEGDVNENMEDDSESIIDYAKDKMKRNSDFILKYFEYYKLGLPLEKQKQIGGLKDPDYSYIEQILNDLSTIGKRPLWDKEHTCKYLMTDSFRERLNIKYEVSENINQNILYRLAKEFHGYTGGNDELELIQFYNEGEGNNTGIYYDKKWKINRDWERDIPIDFSDIENILDKKDWSWSAFLFAPSYRKGIDRMDLDSPIEAADKKIMAEYKNKLKTIIKEEKQYKKDKKKIEQQVFEYIKNQCEGKDGYVELTYDLILKAKKAGIGKVEQYSFTMKNGKIFALCTGDNKDNILNFDKTNIGVQYEFIDKLRDKLTKKEENLISSVDSVCKKLVQIKSVEGDLTNLAGNRHTDELDIPVELERIISAKTQDWDKVKQSLLYMYPESSKNYLCEKAKEYYDYFDSMYRGILHVISNYTVSNDLNESVDFLQAYSFGQNNIVEIKGSDYVISESVNKTIGKKLPELFKLYKNESGITVDELLKKEETCQEGQILAKQIYTICLEESVLDFTGGKISDFHVDIDRDSEFNFNNVKSKLDKEMSKYGFYKNISVVENMNISNEVVVDEKIKIKKISKIEIKTGSEINSMTNKIIKTLNNVDWAGKRGNPSFILNEKQDQKGKIIGKLKSWGYNTDVDINMDSNNEKIKSIYVKKCGMTFINIQEGLRVANLINRLQLNIKENPYGSHKWIDVFGIKTHVGTYKKYKRDNGELQREIDNNPVDLTILESATINKYYPNIKNSKKFLDAINSLFNN